MIWLVLPKEDFAGRLGGELCVFQFIMSDGSTHGVMRRLDGERKQAKITQKREEFYPAFFYCGIWCKKTDWGEMSVKGE